MSPNPNPRDRLREAHCVKAKADDAKARAAGSVAVAEGLLADAVQALDDSRQDVSAAGASLAEAIRTRPAFGPAGLSVSPAPDIGRRLAEATAARDAAEAALGELRADLARAERAAADAQTGLHTAVEAVLLDHAERLVEGLETAQKAADRAQLALQAVFSLRRPNGPGAALYRCPERILMAVNRPRPEFNHQDLVPAIERWTDVQRALATDPEADPDKLIEGAFRASA